MTDLPMRPMTMWELRWYICSGPVDIVVNDDGEWGGVMNERNDGGHCVCAPFIVCVDSDHSIVCPTVWTWPDSTTCDFP